MWARNRDRYVLVVTTQDWHIDPKDDHFDKYPAHCVADSPGAEFDPELSRGAGREFSELVDVQVHKGQYAGDLSGFRGVDESGKPLGKLLGERGVQAVDVCGLAEDVCVAATIRDALWGPDCRPVCSPTYPGQRRLTRRRRPKWN